MTRRRTVVPAGLALLAASACGGTGAPELQPGEPTPAVVTDVPDPVGDGRFLVGVELGERAVDARRRILVELDAADIVCDDGSAADLASVRVGQEALVERSDRLEVPRAVPPIITGRRLELDCG